MPYNKDKCLNFYSTKHCVPLKRMIMKIMWQRRKYLKCHALREMSWKLHHPNEKDGEEVYQMIAAVFG